MKKDDFNKFLEEKVLILDGATGTQLQEKGMPKGVCPEQWVLDNPEKLIELQKQYLKSGSDVVYSCTFGANGIKLKKFGLENQVFEMNKDLAKLSKEAVGGKGFVAGDISSTGQFIKPMGEIEFEEAVDIFKEQARGLLEGGVDLFIIETMVDIREARAALIAVKEICDLPVCVTMTFDENKRTLTGTDPKTAMITLQSLGADAIGCNCSTGPEGMVDIVSEMKRYAKVPVIAKPNAGLPKMIDGKTVFDMGAKEFGKFGSIFVENGVSLVGGCCGTTPQHISEISKTIAAAAFSKNNDTVGDYISSMRTILPVGKQYKAAIISAENNQKIRDDILNGETDEIMELVLDAQADEADIIYLSACAPDIDEKKALYELTNIITQMVHIPLCFVSSSPEAVEAALRVYPGRAMVKCIHEVKKDMSVVIDKYGAVIR